MSDPVQLPLALVEEVTREASRPTSPLLGGLTRVLHERFGDSLVGILLYGSCLHDDDVTEGLVDLYAVVGHYRDAYPEWHLGVLNRWLPPNVFYVEAPERGAHLRAKYAVISLEHFEAGCADWFHPYVWARFAQPFRILYARDEEARSRLLRAAARAVVRFLRDTAPTLGVETISADEIWVRGLELTYAAELRPEGAKRARYLADRSGGYYGRVTDAALEALSGHIERDDAGRLRAARSQGRAVRRGRRAWTARRLQGRLLSVLRLTKAVLTFENGVDYAAWKIERHTGVSVEVTPRLRRYPWIFGWGALWRLLRTGALR